MAEITNEGWFTRLQCVPSHVGVLCNKRAGGQAMQGALFDQSIIPISLRAALNQIEICVNSLMKVFSEQIQNKL